MDDLLSADATSREPSPGASAPAPLRDPLTHATMLRLAIQLERLSEIAEALTYRLLDLEERMLARDDPDQQGADPQGRIGED